MAADGRRMSLSVGGVVVVLPPPPRKDDLVELAPGVDRLLLLLLLSCVANATFPLPPRPPAALPPE